ncbi:MAG: hypothetical protein LBJ08_06935 [Bifidobacteriaceae bacterium]|jgi:hypothetical protein|nr:hypothetical protein [Bifidobacteriaceae bacterium]
MSGRFRTGTRILLVLAGVSLGVGALAPVAYADSPEPSVDKIEIETMGVTLAGPSVPLTVSRSPDGTVFTVDDTKGWDVENNPLYSLRVTATFNVPIVGYIHSGQDDYWTSASSWAGGQQLASQYTQVAPYDTDPDYVIITFTLYESVDCLDTKGRPSHVAIASTRNDFTIRLKKWERQYVPKVTAPGWLGSNFFLSTSGVNRVSWSPIPGQAHHWQVRAATGVTFPYTIQASTAIHYQTRVYLDGTRIQLPGNGDLWSQALVFTSTKTSYEFRIDPPSNGSWNDKQTVYVPSYWHVNVTGSDPADTPPGGGGDGGGGVSPAPGGGDGGGGVSPAPGPAPGGGGDGGVGASPAPGDAVKAPAKAASKVSAKVKVGAKKVVVTVKVANGAKATGNIKLALTKKTGGKTVKVKWSGKASKTIKLTANSKGKATVSLPKVPKGTYTITATFLGNTDAARAAAKAPWKVRSPK